MQLDFTLEQFKELAISTNSINYENGNTAADAFLIVLRGVDYHTIETLCNAVSKKLYFGDPRKIYDFIQKDGCNQTFKEMILNEAYELIHKKEHLGYKMIDGKFNAASWIEHSLYEGEVASVLAAKIGLNPDCAKKLGILHDVGRKFTHKFEHTIKGYEYLYALGLRDEAICCLTHSFLSIPVDGKLKGNRCANCDPTLEGFYIDSNGNGVFSDDTTKDDITLFLENYQYNLYDTILNISDLMATSEGIVSPYERVMDIYTRKTPDPKNSSFFKVCFISSMSRILFNITNDNKYLKIYNINDFESEEDIEKLFIEYSKIFMDTYEKIVRENRKSIYDDLLTGNKKAMFM